MVSRSRIKDVALALLVAVAAAIEGDYLAVTDAYPAAKCSVKDNILICKNADFNIPLADLGRQFKIRFENRDVGYGNESTNETQTQTCITFDYVFDPYSNPNPDIEKTSIWFCVKGQVTQIPEAELIAAISGENYPQKTPFSEVISAQDFAWKYKLLAFRQLQSVQTITISRYSANTLKYTFSNFVNLLFRRNEVTTDLRPRFSATGETAFQYALQSIGGGIQNVAYLTLPSNLATISINFDTACLHPIVVANVNGYPTLDLSDTTSSPPYLKVTGGVFGLSPTQSSGFTSKTLSYPNLSIQEAQSYGLFSQTYSYSLTGGVFASYMLLYCPLFSANATSWTMNIRGSMAGSTSPNSTSSGSSSSSSSDSINYTGLIVGVVVGGVVLIALIILVIICFIWIRRSKAKKEPLDSEVKPTDDGPISYQTGGAYNQSELTPVYPQQVQTYQIQPNNPNNTYPQFEGKEAKFVDNNAGNLNNTQAEAIPIHNVNLDSQIRNPNEIRKIREETKP